MSTPEDILARLAMPKRLAALQRSGLMDSEQDEDFDRVTRLARALLGSEFCLVSFVDERRQFFKSSIGLPEPVRSARQTPLSHSFCKHVVASEQPLVVEDARKDPRVADNLAVSDLNVIAYLGAPIFGPEGDALGALCVIESRPRAWSPGDMAALQDFARLLENVINVRSHARDALRAATSNAVLAREYNHRIKNSFAVSAGLVRAAGRGVDSVDELVRDCSDRFASLGRAQDLVIGEHESTEMEGVVQTVLKPFAYGGNCEVAGPPVTLNPIQIMPLALLLHELATNSVKYGALKDGGRVETTWRGDSQAVTLTWREETRLANGLRREGGVGAKVLEVAARQLEGRIERDYAEGMLTIETTFPAKPTTAPDGATA